MTKLNPFRYFKTSADIIRLAVMLYVRFPLSLRNVEDLLHERGIEISHETVRFWWSRFGPLFVEQIWPVVCGRNPQEACQSDACILELAMTFGRGFCEDQRQNPLPLAGR